MPDLLISVFKILPQLTTHYIYVSDLEDSTSECQSKNKGILESRSSVENCAKKLFSSPGAKHRFTRHPSLIKLAKSIQEDRRKISSAPSSPVKSSLSEYRTFFFIQGYYCVY